MPLSRTMTAKKFWIEAVRDLNIHKKIYKWERFSVVNRAVHAVAGTFYSLMTNDYRKSFTATVTATNEIDLSSQGGSKIRLMRLGAQTQIVVESSASTKKPCIAVSMDEYLAFRTTDLHNRMDIIWTLEGEKILLKQGSGISTVFTSQTIIVHYPAIPTDVTADADLVDIADGPAVEIAITKAKMILGERFPSLKKDYTRELKELVASLYQNFGVQASLEDIEGKVKAVSS